MCKIIGPLFSLDASCSIGKVITFMKRGKVLFVRRVSKPAQIWSKTYTFQKYIHGGCSKAVARIERDWIYHDEILRLGFEKADFQAQVIGRLKSYFLKTQEDFHSLWQDSAYHPYSSRFFIEAKARYFQEFIAPWWEPAWGFDRTFQLYILAELAVFVRKARGNIFNFWPYTIEIEDWGAVEIDQHAERVRRA